VQEKSFDTFGLWASLLNGSAAVQWPDFSLTGLFSFRVLSFLLSVSIYQSSLKSVRCVSAIWTVWTSSLTSINWSEDVGHSLYAEEPQERFSTRQAKFPENRINRWMDLCAQYWIS